MVKVILAGGGTGGHLYPGIAIAEKLKVKGVECLFLVSDRGIDREILSKTTFPFIEQKVTAFKGKSVVGKMASLAKLLPEIFKIAPNIQKKDKVVLLGGFASIIAGIVSVVKRNELYIHEQNSVMGLTNRTFAKFADKVFLSFEKTLNSKGNCIVTGNPVRNIFADIKIKNELSKNILVIGGSQGSRIINKLIVNSSERLLSEGFSIWHQTGKNLYEETLKMYSDRVNKNLKLFAYIDDMKSAYEWADVIISRAGSGSVFEIIYAKRPAIYIPLKIAADNHQKINALSAKGLSAAEILEEEEATVDNLMNAINNIYTNYEQLKEKIKKIEFKDTAELIVKEMGID
jgi:UDP-N-acetylglucosamine--N-acetylmuramyl-(pentapeptide) pyrophosphoryl-undecaprenol N-acetylglucosamine transferase